MRLQTGSVCVIETAEQATSRLDGISPSVELFVEAAKCKIKNVLASKIVGEYLGRRDVRGLYAPKFIPSDRCALVKRASRLHEQWETIQKDHGQQAANDFLSETSFGGLAKKYKRATLLATYPTVVVAAAVVAADNDSDDDDLDTYSDAATDPLPECPAAQTADAFGGTLLGGVSIVVDCACYCSITLFIYFM